MAVLPFSAKLCPKYGIQKNHIIFIKSTLKWFSSENGSFRANKAFPETGKVGVENIIFKC